MADRENGRIQCFLAQTGEFVKEIRKDEFGGKVFAITYSPAGGELRSTSTAGLSCGGWASGPALVQLWSRSGPALVQVWSTLTF